MFIIFTIVVLLFLRNPIYDFNCFFYCIISIVSTISSVTIVSIFSIIVRSTATIFIIMDTAFSRLACPLSTGTIFVSFVGK